MRYTLSVLALALAVSARPAPTKRQQNLDLTVLKFADVLEQFESGFYSAALSKFQESDFTSAGFVSSDVPVQQFTVIQTDEATHSTVLQSAIKLLGDSPITSCQFNFDSALTDVATMAATARVVENLGVAAYLGAAPLVTDPVILQDAGSILTVEARHQTVLNILSGSGTSIPAAFDIGLTPSEVLAVATPFFSGPCDLGVPANPTLQITSQGSVGPGTTLTFKSDAINGSTDNFHCQMLIGGNPTSLSLPIDQCTVPDGLNGPVAIFITSDDQPLVNNVRDRATTQLVAGPTLAFIDTQPQMIGQMLRISGNGAEASTTTQTISPDQASSVIASGSQPTDAASSSSSGSSSSSSSTPSAVNNGVNNGGVPVLTTGPNKDGSITVNGWNVTQV
ncbi:hypothetical protein K435DRAFT_656988 [Dendrothele bispora CBS 962.96]|uniref:Ferritin-like domain-containing protein n=1 Tax=Dendrothele bispora (strain CBS 962.96) TaxID=1314807 RepID=A0A4S8MDG0_DENBC|nr:hypothetical protein K435DRAFT_656988 [Dendrothele bispora CBS 962.96]